MTKGIKIETFGIRGGAQCLARTTKQYGTTLVTYSNATQAYKKASEINNLGIKLLAEVIQPNRSFLVKITTLE